MRIITTCLIAVCVLLMSGTAVSAQALDGRWFDQGHAMTKRSPHADAELDAIKQYIGQWDVRVTRSYDGQERASKGTAEVAYMNRGHAFQEHRHEAGIKALRDASDSLGFLTWDPATRQWGYGEASTYTEHVTIHTGQRMQQKLVLATAERLLGGMQLTHSRVTYDFKSADAFSVTIDVSLDDRASWTLAERRDYTRREHEDGFMAVGEDHGQAAADRVPQAAQFDFLIGTGTASHDMLLGGNQVKFPTTTTAVHTLGGRAVLEHSWNDVDASLPDAATTILRIYNRSANRWESLYLNNRGNALLYFGGQWEAGRMVLHNFDTNLSLGIVRYVFHDITTDGYRWYAESSKDRGKTFQKTWTIEVKFDKARAQENQSRS